MWIKVKLYGTLRRLASPQTPGIWQGEIPEGWTIRDLLAHLGAGRYEACAAMINGAACPLETEIPADAEVVVVPPVGGGLC
ncbi:MAG: hypothetical protein HPY45_16800 [Anaerolineae bacterium]|nr:hypothetical protein [Anaerolineae bacterium]